MRERMKRISRAASKRYRFSSARRVLVTAAASGIGRSVAEAFVEAGDHVHVCDIDEAELEKLEGVGTTVADVADPDAVDRLFTEAAETLGGLDVLVNNAGISGPTAPVEAIEPGDWRRTIDINLNGQFYCVRRAVPLLKAAGGGSIVNISSTAGLCGYPLRSAYAASKWGVIGLTKTLAMELGTFAIRVNAICPGSVAGERIERVIRDEAASRGVSPDEVRTSFLKQVSMRTFVDAADIVGMILFLCSDQGAKISGQALAIDGHTESLTQDN